ncbi:unnamed protein product [Dovyalis caffra]|uniref:AT1G08220-like protein n=1 Tax=Dovyalis caffra TaxID=77055 RepID=A0AAV1RAS8_9ROSI|nr:unnamed protein product [Dovyalis caffra]
MLRLNRLIKHAKSWSRASTFLSSLQQTQIVFDSSFPCQHFSQTQIRFFDIYQIGNKAAIEKERARLADELNRGYFADLSEFKKHGGKIAVANKIIIPAAAAVKFPDVEVNYSNGTSLKLPIRSDGNVVGADATAFPNATLMCLSFRASSQAMTNSWSVPFLEAFRDAKDVQLYEVSFIDSWFLCLSPIKKILLRMLRKSNSDGNDSLQKQIVYSFGDHYYFRKDLRILNLLTGYIFLLDKFGRIRWHGFGSATEEELSSLVSCTSLLLEEK